jgi:hypothetical protein
MWFAFRAAPWAAAVAVPVGIVGASGHALAQAQSDEPEASGVAPATPPLDRAPSAFAKVEPPPDPTGGAYTTPTLLFIPAAAMPVWNARVIASITTEGPTAADRLASGTTLGFQPGLGAEIGLPAGFTVGAGTVWVGGDTSPMPVSGGLSPYAQARYQILGDRDGHGFLLGTSATYKFVGFDGDPGEIEVAVSGQYRQSHYEVGLQGVLGKDFASTDADAEVHAYAFYRVIPELGIGAAVQLREALVSQPDETSYDVATGAIASLTLGRWQVGALGGASTIGQAQQGQFGGLAQLFGTARF